MFLHIENQTILWNSLKKSPYIVEFQQKYAAHRETWFRGIVEQFYTQWISQHQSIPQTANELLEMNKAALKIMVSDLKRLLGYHSASLVAAQNNSVGKTEPFAPYDVASEKKKREDKWSSEFSQYQEEYNRMLAGPVLPRNVLAAETMDERIQNADELLAEYAKRRELDLPAFTPPANTASSQPPAQPPRLKILDEIRPPPPNTKTVSWSERLESAASEPDAYECSI